MKEKFTITQDRIMEDLIPNGQRYEFIIKPDGVITHRRELEAVEELITRHLVTQVVRHFDPVDDGIMMTVALTLPMERV